MTVAFSHETHSPTLALSNSWQGAATATEITLHQLSPYIGKIKSSIAASLISQFTRKGQLVFDPFAGSGTVPLEAWIAGRRPVANDLNPYAALLTQAKLFPYKSLENALSDIGVVARIVRNKKDSIDLRTVPKWVRKFFDPETLRETLLWVNSLRASKRYFLLACLMGILHHQRPGFLSYPSSHSVPYLRSTKFPETEYPELYEYRELQSRLEAKVRRAFRRSAHLDFTIQRICTAKNARKLIPNKKVDAIITSPPYMRSLDYARDNRLRLWFLGSTDWRTLDTIVSPDERGFIRLMRDCFELWQHVLTPSGRCVIIAGDSYSRAYDATISDVITKIATQEIGAYRLVATCCEQIPEDRRVRRRYSGNSSETILVFSRE